MFVLFFCSFNILFTTNLSHLAFMVTKQNERAATVKWKMHLCLYIQHISVLICHKQWSTISIVWPTFLIFFFSLCVSFSVNSPLLFRNRLNNLTMHNIMVTNTEISKSVCRCDNEWCFRVAFLSDESTKCVFQLFFSYFTCSIIVGRFDIYFPVRC